MWRAVRGTCCLKKLHPKERPTSRYSLGKRMEETHARLGGGGDQVSGGDSRALVWVGHVLGEVGTQQDEAMGGGKHTGAQATVCRLWPKKSAGRQG